MKAAREYPERELTERIIGALIEVHSHLGPGLLESAYEECACHEMALRGMLVERQRALPIDYKGLAVDCAYRLDVVVENRVLLELKAVDEIVPIHRAQILTYMRLSGIQVGLLVNFNKQRLKDGIHRFVI